MSAKNKKIALAIIVAILGLTITVAGLLSTSRTISSSGTITTVNLSVFSDSACTQNLTSINWGQTTPGNNATTTIYIENTSNTQITLSMTTSSWNPSTSNSYMTITWNKEGSTLNVGNTTAAVLTLTVYSNITGITSFSVNIILTGTSVA